jgi:hypothetical protein
MGKAGRLTKGFAGVYAGYKWVESHADDVQRWCDKAIEQTRSKPYGRYVEPPARLLTSAAKWIDQKGGGSQSAKKKS